MAAKKTELYLNHKGAIHGPFSKKKILQLYDTGQINEETIIGAAFSGEQPAEKSFIKLKESKTFVELPYLRTEHIMLTTETSIHGNVIAERLGIVTAECAFGMNLLKDLFAGVRDIVGGRSKSTQKVLRDSRETVLAELRNEAYLLDADAVIAIDLDYSEFSGGGKSMLFIVASGTAVKLNSKL